MYNNIKKEYIDVSQKLEIYTYCPKNKNYVKGVKKNGFGCLVGWVLWHINLCRLFNAKSIFMQTASSTSNNSV